MEFLRTLHRPLNICTRLALCALVGAGLFGCATNKPANADQVLTKKPASGTDYSFTEWLKAQPDNINELVVMSFSGGGVRAASLAVGTLEALHEKDLDSKIALISSTSGGSVASAIFAAKGPDGLRQLNESFLARDNMADLIPRLVPKVIMPGVNRSADFANFLEERLFAGGPLTYGGLIPKWQQKPPAPFVILNSTDMSSGRTFEFTQGMFSNICSDIRPFRLAQAVTASAAFPFLINPMPLQNYWTNTNCRPFVDADPNEDVKHWSTPAFKYLYPDQLGAARYRQSLQYSVNPRPPGAPIPDREIEYVHLLDGGLADNLGIRPLLRALSDNYALIKQKGVRSILLVQVNARSSKPNAIDVSGNIPSLVDVFWSVTLNPIDIATELSAYAAREFLVDLAKKGAGGLPGTNNAIAIYPAQVDFALMDEMDQRHRAEGIGTSWTLKGGQDTLSFLKSVANKQINTDPCFNAFEQAHQGLPVDPDGNCAFLQLSDISQPPVNISDLMDAHPPAAGPPAMAYPPAAPPPPPAAFRLSLEADVFFEFDQAALKPEGKLSLNNLAVRLVNASAKSVLITGHTDSVGGKIYNLGLSLARAEAVRDYLASSLNGLGYSAKLQVEGRGASEPLASNGTATGRSRNRRVEIEVQ